MFNGQPYRVRRQRFCSVFLFFVAPDSAGYAERPRRDISEAIIFRRARKFSLLQEKIAYECHLRACVMFLVLNI